MTSTEETLAGGSPEDPPKEAEENELQELPRKDETQAPDQQEKHQEQPKQEDQPQSPEQDQPQQQDQEQEQQDQETKQQDQENKQQDQEKKQQDQEKKQQDQEKKQQDQEKKQQDQEQKQQDREKKQHDQPTKQHDQEKKQDQETQQQEKKQQPQQDQQQQQQQQQKQKQEQQKEQQQQQPEGETPVAKAPLRKNRSVPFIPPTVEALGGISQMVVKSIHCNSHKGGKYQVLGENKSVLFQVRRDWEPNECKCFKFLRRVPLLACCNRNTQPMKFFLRDLMMQDALITEVNFDSRMCCFNTWTADVTLSPDVKMGSISNDGSWRRLVLTNPAGDRLLTVQKEQRCCDKPNYTIFSLEGAQVGEITTELSKTRMKITKEIDMKWKVLLLCFAIVVQHEQEQRESKSQQQNPY
ncbi:uncharacterized protein [Macrobrachium rosenbergii]|uniref:uncharacterized protein n=1 Tax=Macrobrachium rosenbergii TaxID=79674 RepID=UPI0034D4982D